MSFFSAILVDQQVISPHPQTARLLEVNNDYELWPIGLESHLKLSNSESLENGSTSDSKSSKKRQNKPTEKIDHLVEEKQDEVHQNES